MKENNKLKRIIDLYVESGEDNIYLRDEMIKAFNNALPEEKKEGYEYLNQKLEEKNGKNKKLKKVIIIVMSVLLIVILIVYFFIDEKESTQNIMSVTTNNITTNNATTNNTSTNNTTTNVTTNKIKHYCEVSGCFSEGTYLINREGGKKEYYCYKHYKQMEKWVKMMFE